MATSQGPSPGWETRIARFIATWFGVGYLPIAPGTWASVSALPLAWFLHRELGAAGVLLGAAAAFALGLWACRELPADEVAGDPRYIVIDEVAGQIFAFTAFAAVSVPDGLFYVTGFALFRFFDILKPWPIDWAEQRLKGGLGVMLDDIVAAIYAGAGVWFIYFYTQAH